MRVFSVRFTGQASGTATFDAFELNAAAAIPCKLLGVELGQATDVGDANEEILTWSIIRGHSTSGSGGATPTAAPMLPTGSAFTGTVETMNTTVATGGTPVTMYSSTWNTRQSMLYMPVPEARIVVAGGSRLVVNVSAPSGSINVTGTMLFEALA